MPFLEGIIFERMSPMADQTKPNNAHVEQRLREEPIVWFTTVRPDGRPHTVPVWFLWDGETFLIFSQPGNLKIRKTITFCTDLRALALVKLAELLPSRRLTRPTLAWCPVCYEEWQACGQILHDPLLWGFQEISLCDR